MKLFNPINHPICFSYPLRTAPSTWTRHVPFAMCLIDLLRPRTLVELGTYFGTSYCAFCQAVKELGLETRCSAVDTWQDDPQDGYYGSETLADLREHHDQRYGSFSQLIQSTFDDAREQFTDGTIDLLHIDGYNSYEAVKHDFDSWLPKMGERGVILLHNTNERTERFGVWKFFEEKKQEHPHFEFLFGHGLGILAIGQHYPEPLRELLEATEDSSASIGAFFFQLGVRIEIQAKLENIGDDLQNMRSEVENARFELQNMRSALQGLSSDEVAILLRSRGVRAIKLARHARHLLLTQGPGAATKQTLFWLGGKRHSGRASRNDG